MGQFADLFDEEKPTQQRAAMNLRFGIEAQPDVAARDQALARRFGLPPAVIEQYRPDYAARAAVADAAPVLEQSPKLRGWLADDAQRAKVAHDDVPQMGAIEAAVKWLVSAPDAPSTLVGSLRSAYYGASAGSAGAFQAVAGTAAPLLDFLEPVQGIGGNPLRRLQEGFGLIAQDALASQKAARGKSATWLGSAVDSGVESLAQNAVFLPLALLPGGQAAALTGMSAMAGGQTYTQDIQKGQGHWPALMHGASDAVIEAGTEMLPMARLIGDIKAGTPLFQTLLKNAALEVPGEQVATALQDLNDWAVNNNGRTFGDYLRERPEAAAQTLIATLVGVGGNVAIMKGVQGVADRAAGTERRAQLAEQHGQALADVSKLIEASKLRQRDPEAFATFAQSLTEEGVSSLYVDARALQQSGVDLQALAQAMPSVAAQLQQAVATGGDVVIPTAEFLTQAPGQEWSAALIDHARTAADAKSPAGAREYMQAYGEQLQEEIAKTIEQHATDQEWQAGRDAVRSSFEAQLNEVGRFTPDVNRQNAALLGDFYAVMASRAGMTPQELAERYPLRIQAKAAGGAVNAMEQGEKMRVIYRGTNDSGEKIKGGIAEGVLFAAAEEGTAKSYAGASGSVERIGVKPDARVLVEGSSEYAKVTGRRRGKLIDTMRKGENLKTASDSVAEAARAAGYDAIEFTSFKDLGIAIFNEDKFVRNYADQTLNQFAGPSARLPATIDIDGQQRSTTNSKGQQIAQTEEGVRAFYRWFKDSRVVDADGQPLVVYHGTAADFDAFDNAKTGANDRGLWGRGHYFAASSETANSYALRQGEGARLIQAYVSIKNPLVLKTGSDLVTRLPDGTNTRELVGPNLDGAKIKQIALDGGHDGVIQIRPNGLIGDVVAFRPDQIKSATGNRGTFDPNDASILNQNARGQIAFGPDITQTPSVISLFDGADLSTLIHEAGHFFLEAHMDLAGRIAGRIADGEQVSDGERGIVADANALLGWFGVTGVEQAGGAGGGALEQGAAWAEPTGKRSPITRKPVFELFDADGKSLGFTHSYVTAEDAIAGRNRPVSGPPAAPTYTLPEPELPPRSNWKQVKGQQFSNLDEDDGFLYHITAADRAAGIRENGLAPNSGGMFGGAYADYSAGKVFLTERSGVSYWQERVELQLQAASDNPPSVVVMRIPKDKITAQLTPDDIGTKDARARAYYSTATLFQTSQQGADQPDARPEPPALGRTPLETWAMMSIDQKRPYHEQFARGIELYALEGKAPSLSLQPVFQRFSAWLKDVYRSITQRAAEDVLQVSLTDEVRQVMDRMIATDEQIAEAQAMREMGPLFGGADQAGMTPEQWAQYHELAAQATAQASEQLQARGLRDMQWLRNARSRELKRLQDRAAGLRREVEMEVRREVLSAPIYRAWQFLTTKGDAQATAQPTPRVRASGALDPASDNLFTAIAKLGGLDRSEVVGAWGVDPKDRLESGVFGAPVLRKEGGLSIDAMAEKLAEEGYLLRDESGRTDPADLEAAFDSQRRGVDQFSTWHDLTEDARVRAATGADAPEALPDEIMHGKLDTAVLRDMYGTKPDALWRTLSDRRMTSEAQGIHPEVVAETFGYDSADALVRALAAADPPRQAIEGLTDQRMLERYGDLATPEGLQREADKAIHNEARARAIATELDALEKMGKARAGGPRTADVLAKAARDYAAAVIGAKKVRDIRPGEYTAAEARASKAAQKAFKAGDTQAAATEKRHQLIQHAAAKAALQAREEIDKTLDYLRRMAKRPKSIAPDYADQIDQLLERFDLRPASLKELDKRAGLQAWVTAQQEQGKEVDIPPELLNEAARTSWRNLTLDELRGLRDTVKQIEHLGRTKGKLLASKAKREFEAVRDELADGIELHSRGRTADTRTPATVLGRRLAAIKRFGAAHIKVATWARIFDGGRDGGPAWEYLIRGANDAGDFETTRRAQATEALTKILSPVITGLQRKAQYPSIGRSLTREQVLVMALNTGNEGNWQRMLDGEGWTRPQVMGVLNTLTAAEWQAVQGVWDHMESYRPEIGAKEKRVYGKEPEWVQSVPLLVDTSDGQRLSLRGGYFPIKYDPAANARAEGHADAEDAKRQMQGAYTSATTRRGFTKSRVQEVKGRPLMYSLSAVYGGVQDVIHDLAWHEWLIDTNKLLRSEKVDAAIRQHYGPEVVKQVKDWVKDIAAGDGPAQGAVDEAVSRLRRGVSVAGLGFNVMSAAMQPLGLTQSMVRVGAAWIGRGVAQYIASPRAAARRVNAASEFMASRARTRFRELNELRNQVEGESGAMQWVNRNAFWLMLRAQQAVDVPTWLGAYEKAISDGSDDARAVALADQAVIDSQGGGQLKDLAGIERGGPAQKLFTVFYSFFNTALNIGIGQGMTADTPAKRAKLAADALLLYSVPAVLGAILKDALQPGGDDDPEELAKKLAAAQLDYLMGLFVLVRETTEAVKIVTGLEDRPRDYAGPAGLRVIPDAFKFAKQAGQGEFDDAFRKASVNLIGSAFGLPAAQVNRTITGAQALAEDETDNPAALVFGFQKER